MAKQDPINTPDWVARLKAQGDIYMAVVLIAFMIIMVIPVPPWFLDMLLAVSISVSMLTLLVTFYVRNPIEFSVFPTILLATTLYRLSLNVATTRLILLNGAEGPDAAGSLIKTFGLVVVGGNYVVGLVVFSILVIINFVVITKGSGRVAEVAARFTLDGMPGKQMAVDAELNSGLIDEMTARRRRAEIMREADFYGAMDGASKFIRGDAIAGILITLINIIGGIVIGVVQNDLALSTALENYTVLTIGDGLLSQIPALIVSSAAGMLVTRVPDEHSRELHEQFSGQLFGMHRPLMLLSVALLGFMLVPGLRLPFFIMGVLAGLASRSQYKKSLLPKGRQGEEGAAGQEGSDDPEDLPVEMLLRVEPLSVELGVDLIGLVDEDRGGNLVERIQRIRRQIAQDLGLLVPAVHLRDNLRLQAGEYRIMMRGEEVAKGKVIPRQTLAINPGDAKGQLKGIDVKDPVFGLDAHWIPDKQRIQAQARGYTCVDVPTVLTTHLTEILHQYGFELFGRQELADILDRVQEENPRLIEELIPDPLSRGAVLRIFRNLLREGVSIRDAQTILEAMADRADRVTDPDALTEFVRQRMARHLTHRYADEEGTIHYIGLGRDAEERISESLHGGEKGAINLTLSPDDARTLLIGLRDATDEWRGQNEVVVLCPPLARGPLRKLTEKVIPRVSIVSPAELLPTVRLERVGVVSMSA